MSRFPGIHDMLQRVRELGDLLTEFAERGTALEREIRTHTEQDMAGHRKAIDAMEQQHAAALLAAEKAYETNLTRTTANFERREERIRDSFITSKQKRTQSVESEEGNRKHRIQIQKMDLDEKYPEALAGADAAYQTVTDQLTERHARLAALTDQVQRAFRGYRGLLSRTRAALKPSDPDRTMDVPGLLEEISDHADQADQALTEFQRRPLPRLFRILPLDFILPVLVLLHAAAAGLFFFLKYPIAYSFGAGGSLVALLVLILILHQRGKSQAGPAATAIGQAMATAGRVYEVCAEKAAMRHHLDRDRIENTYSERYDKLDTEWQAASTKAESRRLLGPQVLKDKLARAFAKNETLYHARFERIQREHPRFMARVKETFAREKEAAEKNHQENVAKIRSTFENDWSALESEWNERVRSVYDAVDSANAIADERFPAWSQPSWEAWQPPRAFAQAARFARLDVDVEKLGENAPRDRRLGLPGPGTFSLPIGLTFPERGAILFETRSPAGGPVADALNNIILRLLTSTPPGKLSFTIIDPVELGQNFAGIMHLADYEETLVNSRIWTQPNQIEQQLADLNEHMEKVIQMYLRNDYKTISEYNEQAGDIAEKYRFLVVSDFPSGFSDLAMKRLLSVAASGARCGVYTLIHWDQRQRLPHDVPMEDLRKVSVCLRSLGSGFTLAGVPQTGTELVLDAPPDTEMAKRLLHHIGETSVDSTRVEVPFEQVAPDEKDRWSRETVSELKVPIGRTGATKLQNLALGQGTRQHALIVGKTGSGKSTLFHVLITNLSLWCSPDKVEFYLVDFKKGVEFKCYATHRLPHARVVAIESDREFGMSVLQRIDEELIRRGELFRKLGVQDLNGYQRAGGGEALPRTLLIVDEFQEYFVEDDRIAQNAALLLDRIVRQGRAFGIHVLLGSQTLGGAYTLARTTLGQMVVRIALQCNEADSYLIMDDGNPAPRLLTRPGEAIYNDAAGALEGNSPFQVVWLPDEERDERLADIRRFADGHARTDTEPIVFEGNAPADIRENKRLRKLLDTQPVKATASARVWLGSPNAIKGPTEAVFRRQSGSNLLIVGQRDEEALTAVAMALITLAAQHPIGTARFILFDGTPPDSPQRAFMDQVVESIPHDVNRPANNKTAVVMNELITEMEQRDQAEDSGQAPAVFMLVFGLQKFKKLKFEEDFSFSLDSEDTAADPGAQFNRLICEGTHLGFHCIAACDTYANVNRFLSRKAVTEFEMRMLFQMSANDSAGLIDSQAAANLGLHRAIFYNEHEGHLETFRPYARPDDEWLDQAAECLAHLAD